MRNVPPERGAALLVAVLIAALLSGLGLALLQTADDETRVAARHRDAAALTLVAETGARAVKVWFDTPIPGDPGAARHVFLDTARFLRDASFYDRMRRADSITTATRRRRRCGPTGLLAGELYRQGRVIAAGAPHLDLFGKRGEAGARCADGGGGRSRPGAAVRSRRRGSLTASTPICSPTNGRRGASSRSRSTALPSGPRATLRLRHVRGDSLRATGAWISSVSCWSRRWAWPSKDALWCGWDWGRSAKNLPRGPLEACGSITARGRMRARWGRAIAGGDIWLPDKMDTLDTLVASAYPYASPARRLTGGALAAWLAAPDMSVEIPALKIVVGGAARGLGHPSRSPFPWTPPSRSIDDYSNLFQRVAGVACPPFPYQE